jgi:hypothetical protein
MPPVVFIVFNRPECTTRVLARIRAAKPRKLYIISDGPRPDRPNEAETVQKVRDIAFGGVDWDCDLTCDFSPVNLGCRKRVASGLSRVFSEVEEAIILEDDCLPDPSFFTFCEAMLTRYRHDEQVVHIGGANLISQYTRPKESYWFTRHAWIWGWASWRRSWQKYDFDMATWCDRLSALRSTFGTAWEAQYWMSTWDSVRKDLTKANTWGFPWMYSCRSSGGLSILPSVNLIQNIGFGEDATHTSKNMKHLTRATQSLGPLVHPRAMEVDAYRDELVTRVYSGQQIGVVANLKSKLRVAMAQHARTAEQPA